MLFRSSPEIWKNKPYNEKSDIWSLGCVLYEVVSLRIPFKAKSMKELYSKITSGICPALPWNYSADLRGLIKSFMQLDPNLRPSCGK